MTNIFLLIASNIFMTFTWYGHLKDKCVPLWEAILVSWCIAFFEYCLMLPANRDGYCNGFNAFQLKISLEIITLGVFTFFAVLYLKEPFKYNYIISFMFILSAVYFAFKKLVYGK